MSFAPHPRQWTVIAVRHTGTSIWTELPRPAVALGLVRWLVSMGDIDSRVKTAGRRETLEIRARVP